MLAQGRTMNVASAVLCRQSAGTRTFAYMYIFPTLPASVLLVRSPFRPFSEMIIIHSLRNSPCVNIFC